ncbi:hypothetical protein IEQ34_008225 [Dendrobium chrysotoxum]|uniref:Pentatricopeptide repeat-containing protein n=1 Tax=Dendrobium chrysotoxum TaxID=161865 RepID=A0AAV7H7R5_DENCH|nr:hypothetical protein IEQ34_008225 [Dendrobium chrysotoxum]
MVEGATDQAVEDLDGFKGGEVGGLPPAITDRRIGPWKGKWSHIYLRRQRLDFDVVIGTAFIDMYGKCGSLAKEKEVFEEILENDVLTWTAMISALAVHGCGEEAFILFEKKM